ncbi:Coatomer subunit beta-2 [Camellia lanceoleosa]|uniref:Coatomer subunit beta-2 n=1 Tax=Camellia lanceoleosa TaxID=1840588 RepID=A0ACC0FJ51_9ERIC|nr:Coatomer subunit beta-2 [Camellia lanceoleosa]
MEKSCSLLIHFDKGTPAIANEIKEALEGNDVPMKVDAMKKAIMLLLNGETLPQLFITIVRYVLPSEDHTIQKLLLLYLEIIDKTDAKGRVLPEMILICQNLRNNLQHPNEYIRGVTLRFLCRLNEAEIIEPLIPSVLANLEHRHPFIRRNAILAVMSIYKLPNGEQLLVDAPEMIEKVLSTEQDQSAKRNAFLMLFTCAQDRAINYLLTHVDRVSEWGELLQMVVLELIRKHTCVFIICPTAVRAAANTYCQLLLSQSDNNVKLIVLDRLNELKASHKEIMVDLIMDVLRALSSPNVDIRRKTLDIVLELITPRNVNEVVLTLKKEVMKTQSGELEKNGEYRQMLIQAIHTCAIKFRSGKHRGSFVDGFLGRQQCCFGNGCCCLLPRRPTFLFSNRRREGTDSSKKSQQVNTITVSSRRPAILADGTYATQSAASETAFSPPTIVQGSLASGNLRSLLLTGDFFLGAVVACSLAKLLLRLGRFNHQELKLTKSHRRHC